jgi:hypothetical protein
MKGEIVVALTIFSATAAMADTVGFDREKIGALPAGWIAGVTGRGAPQWAVIADPKAPSAPHVLQQSGSGTFPWCVKQDVSLADGFVEVKLKPISGREDQAGGVVWRWKDGDNYYVARANALENTAPSATRARASVIRSRMSRRRCRATLAYAARRVRGRGPRPTA